MKQRPILFSTPMVQAILDGRKTQTRRVVKPQPSFSELFKEYRIYEGIKSRRFMYEDGSLINPDICPYGQPGDVLWVKETFGYSYFHNSQIRYKATDQVRCEFNKGDAKFLKDERWKPSIHMPKDACRIWLEITNVRVERLQDISEDDARREGVQRHWRDSELWKDYTDDNSAFGHASPSFISLWNSINGSESWSANPFVWVLEFKQISKPK